MNPASVGPSQHTRVLRVRSSAWGQGKSSDVLEPSPPRTGVASLPEGTSVDDARCKFSKVEASYSRYAMD